MSYFSTVEACTIFLPSLHFCFVRVFFLRCSLPDILILWFRGGSGLSCCFACRWLMLFAAAIVRPAIGSSLKEGGIISFYYFDHSKPCIAISELWFNYLM